MADLNNIEQRFENDYRNDLFIALGHRLELDVHNGVFTKTRNDDMSMSQVYDDSVGRSRMRDNFERTLKHSSTAQALRNAGQYDLAEKIDRGESLTYQEGFTSPAVMSHFARALNANFGLEPEMTGEYLTEQFRASQESLDQRLLDDSRKMRELGRILEDLPRNKYKGVIDLGGDYVAGRGTELGSLYDAMISLEGRTKLGAAVRRDALESAIYKIINDFEITAEVDVDKLLEDYKNDTLPDTGVDVSNVTSYLTKYNLEGRVSEPVINNNERDWYGYTANEEKRFDDKGRLLAKEDSAATRLGMYFSAADKKTLDTIFGYPDKRKSTLENTFIPSMSDSDIARAESVLRHLNNQGISYDVQLTTGQNKVLKLNLDDKSYRVSIYNERFPEYTGQLEAFRTGGRGSVQQIYKYDLNTNVKAQRDSYVDRNFVDDKAIIQLIDLARGGEVKHEGMYFQTQSAADVSTVAARDVHYTDRANAETFHGASWKRKRLTGVGVSASVKRQGGFVIDAPMDIIVDARPGLFTSTVFKQKEDAVQFMQESITEARANMMRTFDVDSYNKVALGLVKAKESLVELSAEGDREKVAEVRDIIKSLNIEKSRMIDESPLSRARTELFFNDMERFHEESTKSSISLDDFKSEFFSNDERSARFLELMQGVNGSVSDIRSLVVDDVVGSYEDGFNSELVARLATDDRRPNMSAAMLSALKRVGYDTDKIIGEGFTHDYTLDRMTKFDESKSMSLAQIKMRDMDSGRVAFGADTIYNSEGEIVGIEKDPARLAEIAKEKPYISHQQRAMVAIHDFLANDSYENINVQIDDKGVIKWSADAPYRNGRDANKRVALRPDGTELPDNRTFMSGEIGQVFDEDPNGIITTNYQGKANYGFIPNTDLYYVVGDEDLEGLHNKVALDDISDPVARRKHFDEELGRLRAKTFEVKLVENIRKELTQQLSTPVVNVRGVGEKSADGRILQEFESVEDFRSVALNDLYSGKNTGKKVPINYATEKAASFGEARSRVIITTERSRAKFIKEYSDNATMRAVIGNEKAGGERDEFTAFDKTGGRGVRVLHEMYQGVFDRHLTGTASNKGSVVYFAEGVSVDDEGRITRSEDLTARTPLMKLPEFRYSDMSDPNRTVMSATQYMTAHDVDLNAGVAYMNVAGFGFDDGFIMSKRYADEHFHPELDGDGKRTLVAGDKIMEMSGNKGVVPLIVDPDMSDEEAKEKGIYPLVRLFRDNPALDVVIPPHSSMSRNNPGGMLMAMEGVDGDKTPQDLKVLQPDGSHKVLKGALGFAPVMVTEQQVDKKSILYDAEAIAEGRGRKFSAQYEWQLETLGLGKVISEAYGNNNKPWIDYREYLNVLGVDLDPNGVPRMGYKAHEGENRKVLTLDELKGMSDEEFLYALNRESGFMDLPFKLEYKQLRSAIESTYDKDVRDQVVEENAFKFQVAIIHPSLRMGREVQDDSVLTHDYTANYGRIFKSIKGYYKAEVTARMIDSELEHYQDSDPEVVNFIKAHKELFSVSSNRSAFKQALTNHYRNTPDKGSNYLQFWEAHNDHPLFATKAEVDGVENRPFQSLVEWSKEEHLKERVISDAQDAFDKISEDINTRVVSGKHNYLREKMMQVRRNHSATLTAMAEPRLDLDQVEISAKTAKELKVSEDGYVLVHRDPVWRSGGIRAYRVKISDDPNLQGFKMNPIMDKSHDGDFDGDGYAFFGGFSAEAMEEAVEKAGVASQLIERSRLVQAYDMEGRPLYVQADGSIDTEVTDNPHKEHPLYVNDGMEITSAEYRDESGRLVLLKRQAQALANAGRGEEALEKLNQWVHEGAFDEWSIGTTYIDLSSPKTMLESMGEFVLDGSKGKSDAIAKVAMWAGLDITAHGYLVDNGGSDLERVDFKLNDKMLRFPGGPNKDVYDREVAGTDNPVGYRNESGEIVLSHLPLEEIRARGEVVYSGALIKDLCEKMANDPERSMPISVDRHMEEVDVNGSKVWKHMSHATAMDLNEAMMAEGIKADFTGDPGRLSQLVICSAKAMSEHHADSASEALYLVIQTNLQIKHSAAQGKRLVGLYTEGGEIYELLHGRNPQDPNSVLTPDEFVRQSLDVYASIGFDDINPQIFADVAVALSGEDEYGRAIFKGIDEGMKTTDLMYRMSHGLGGLSALVEASMDDKSLFTSGSELAMNMIPEGIRTGKTPLVFKENLVEYQEGQVGKELTNLLDKVDDIAKDIKEGQHVHASIVADSEEEFVVEEVVVTESVDKPDLETGGSLSDIMKEQERFASREHQEDSYAQDRMKDAGLEADAFDMSDKEQEEVLEMVDDHETKGFSFEEMGLTAPVIKQLEKAGVTDVEAITKMEREKFNEIKGVGATTMSKVDAYFEEKNLNFKTQEEVAHDVAKDRVKKQKVKSQEVEMSL